MAQHIRNLGSFDSIQKVWAALPGGGQEGDYLTIDGNTFSWNKYIRQWQNDTTVINNPARETQTHDGDYNVGNNMRVGGDLIVIGKIINDSIKNGKSAYEIWLENGHSGNISDFLAWMKDTSSMIGPKFAATVAECVMVNETPTMYYVPNGSTFNVYLADSNGQGVNAHSLATGVPGDITNYAGIYDISQDHINNGVPASYGSLSDAIGAIDASKKKGGMTIKYISTDGKYHQYRLIRTTFPDTFSLSDWECLDDAKLIEVQKNLTNRLNGLINSNNGWSTTEGFYNYQIPIRSGWRYRITANADSVATVVFLKYESPRTTVTPYISDIDSTRHIIGKGKTLDVIAPDDATYMYVAGGTSSAIQAPSSIIELQPIEEVTLNVGDSLNLVDEGSTFYKNDILFDNTLVPEGSIIHFVFDTINNKTTFIEFIDIDNNRLSYFGRGGDDQPSNHYDGYVTVPDKYSKAKVFSTSADGGIINVRITTSKIYVSKSKGQDGAEDNQEIETLSEYALGKKVYPSLTDDKVISGINGTISGNRAVIGQVVSYNGFAVSNYIWVCGAKFIRLTKALLGSSYLGIVFYGFPSYNRVVGEPIILNEYSARDTYKVVDIKVPDGANYFRFTCYASDNSRYFEPWYQLIYTNDAIFKDAVAAMVGTHIIRSCKSISQGVLDNNAETNYAFSANMFIAGSYAYVIYSASNAEDGDSQNPSIIAGNKSCVAKINIETGELETTYISPQGYYDENGEAVSNYKAACVVPIFNGTKVVRIGQMYISGQKNPIVCSTNLVDIAAINTPSYKMCTLSYNNDTVRFSWSNYRQMLEDKGYINSAPAISHDLYDNNAVFYDKDSNKHYMLICGTGAQNISLPLMLLESNDTYNWTINRRIGTNVRQGGEISAIIDNNKLYAAIRTLSGVGWIVYDLQSDNIISEGTFIGSLLSRPYVFKYLKNIYMVINVDPSVYGYVDNVDNSYATAYQNDARNEINIYVINTSGIPTLMRKINNPTGINYHTWCQTPPHYDAKSGNETMDKPHGAYGSLYCAFSEDRRILYKRHFSQVSFGDVTALFAYADRAKY